MSNNKSNIPVFGGSSLLVIFAVLCLTVFTLLALSTAQADNRLAESSAKAVSDYYEADLTAETILAQLRQGDLPTGVEINGNTYSYTCPISDTQILCVEVLVGNDSWQILRWQAVSTVTYDEQ